jgi:iron(II)-dependent oxidoreductase
MNSRAIDTLSSDLVASRDHFARITAALEGERLLGPQLAIVNPPVWEIGHVGWFQEHWCLRWRGDGRLGLSILPNADQLYDSSNVAHDTRWDLPLPNVAATRAYLANVLEQTLERLAREPENERLRYFVRLATLHEDMHAEALHYTHQTLGYPDPDGVRPLHNSQGSDPDLEFAGGSFRLGAERGGERFVFDNEKWAHDVELTPFAIGARPVSNAQYLEYVEDGGAALLAKDRRCMARASLRYLARAGCASAGEARRLERGAGVVSLGRAAATHRGRVAVRWLAHALGRGVGVDREHLCAVSGLQRRSLCRLLAAVVRHAQGAERRELRDAAAPRERQLPQLLHGRARRRLCRFSHL